jgi:FAD:protein FMN transferase
VLGPVIGMSFAEIVAPGLHLGSLVRTADRAGRRDLVRIGDRTAAWTVRGRPASVTVSDPEVLPAARQLAGSILAAAGKAADATRADAEVHRLYRAAGRPITVSAVLADLVAAALVAAERTDGDVDPTVAAAVTAVHGRRRAGPDHSALPVCGARASASRPAPGWERVDLAGRRLRVPAGTTLDLSATASAVACDRAAAAVRDRLGVGVLVTLGADAAAAGAAPDDGWSVTVEDRTGDLSTQVRVPAGGALATSHFTSRSGPSETGHLIDPRTGRPPRAVWRMATAVGFSCLEAATWTAAALVRGAPARAWLNQLWVPARLVTVNDDVITAGPWAAHFPTSRPVPAPRPGHPGRTTNR